MQNSFMKSVVLITALSIITRALGFLFRIVLSQVLGAEIMGVYQVAFSTFFLLLSLVSSGVPLIISSVTAREGAKGADKAARVHSDEYVSSGITVSLIIAAVVTAAVLIFNRPISRLMASADSIKILNMLLPAIIATAVYSSLKGSLWGRQQYLSVSMLELLEQTCRIALCFILVNTVSDPLMKAEYSALSLSIACVLNLTVTLVLYRRRGNRLRKPKHIKPLLKTSTPITVMKVASSLINFLVSLLLPARLIAGGMTASAAMEAYGASMGMAVAFLYMPLTVTGSISMALVPELSAALEQNNYSLVARRIESALSFACMVACLLLPVYLTLGNQIGALAYNNIASGEFLSRGAIAMVPIALEQITSSMMNSLNLERRAFVNFSIGTGVLILCLYFLPPLMGIDSLIAALTMSYGVSTVLHVAAIRKKTKISLRFLRSALISLLAAAPSALLGYFLFNIFYNSGLSQLFAMLLSLVAILACQGMLYLCFDLLNLNKIFITLFGKPRKKQPRTPRNTSA